MQGKSLDRKHNKIQIAEKAYEDAANGSPIKGRIMETEYGLESTKINHIDVEAAKIFIRRLPWESKD